MPRRKIDRSTSGFGDIIDVKSGEFIEEPIVPRICARIKFYREKLGLEQKQVAAQLGINKNTVSNWEIGRSRPDINLIPDLCRVLNITLYELFEMDDPRPKYTENETLLLSRYRTLSAGHRHVVDKLVQSLDLIEVNEDAHKITKLLYLERQLAAGIGDPTDFDDEGTPIFLYSQKDIDRADYVFTVNGDSMEPDFHSGDMVLVEKIPDGPDIKEGEVGAFIIGSETYIKVFERDGLHSLNKKYSVMKFEEYESVYLIGRVIRILDQDEIASRKDVQNYEEIHGRL